MLDVDIARTLGDFRLEVAFKAPLPGVVALFGPSGSGKTSIVQAIAGLQAPDRGRIAVGDSCLYDAARGFNVAAEHRRMGYVFQDGRLFPHLRVEANLRFGQRRAPGPVRPGEFDAVVALLGLQALLHRRPATLSGGEKQRVALGRALLAQPRLLLMDEPLAALDAARKEEVLPYIERLRDELGLPMVFVSHAWPEVARLADTLVLIEAGRVVTSGPLVELTARSDLAVLAERDDAGSVIDTLVVGHDRARMLTRLAFQGGGLDAPLIDLAIGARLRVRIQARDVIVATGRPDGLSLHNVLPARVRAVVPVAGPQATVALDVGGTVILARITKDAVTGLGLAPGVDAYALIKSVAVDRIGRRPWS
jgi:molybdate transport system ATP-binding protein